MKLAVLGVIVGVYWYCCCFQSSICGEQSLLVPTWIQPFVCLPEEGKGTRQPLWFTVGPGPAWLWPPSKLVIVSPRSSSRPLSFPLSSFSHISLSAPVICPLLPPASVSFFYTLLCFHTLLYSFSLLLSLPSYRSFLYLSIFFRCLSSYHAWYHLSVPTINRQISSKALQARRGMRFWNAGSKCVCLCVCDRQLVIYFVLIPCWRPSHCEAV